jgi:ATP-dependent DNA ligase
MTESNLVADRRSWRPQGFGRRHRARDIADPIIEPLWSGLRVLVHVEGSSVAIDDEFGEPAETQLEDGPAQLRAIEAAVREGLLAESAILDGYLSPQAMRSTVGATVVAPSGPTATDMASQMLIGNTFRPKRRGEGLEAPPDFDVSGRVAFVAVDLLALDGDSLLDVPLLERKRLLDSAVEESELVRHGAYVRPPIDTWLASWRALGFSGLAYKAANSRYQPGEDNEGWATAPIPSR